ncbi:MAG: M3 family metallopeptidase [Acidobacteria bacterium]|nr:M3 family metallopeptidase [Acidobacteriota bacterium]
MTQLLNDNPLLHPGFLLPFDRIAPEHVEPAITQLIAEAEARLAQFSAEAGGSPRTYANTLERLDKLTEPLDLAMGIVRHLEGVATTAPLREAYNRVEPLAAAFYSRLPLDEGIWNALQAYAETDEAKKLTGTRRRYLTRTLSAFRRQGAALPRAQKAELEKIDVELAQVTTKYSENVLDSTNSFEYLMGAEEELSGLPPTAVVMARESAEAKGKPGWRFTLQAPSYLAVMTYLDDARVRELVYRAYQSRATREPHGNELLLLKTLQLRRAKAVILGYRDFADYAIDERMAVNGEKAQAFLNDLKRKTERHFARENQELNDFRRQLEGAAAPPVEPWDLAYYAEKLRRAKYDLDEEMLRPYFPLDQVVQGMFEIVCRLFGVRVVERLGVPVWDPAVKFYDLQDAGGQHLASFYADWFPRENKRGGAWMDAFITGSPVEGRPGVLRPHLGLMCGNMTPPTAGKPALLTHREVETVFHEFGHLLHHSLSRVDVRSLSGTNVAWDFVELPSQIMENWCWERESLDLFARHYETGAPLPEELFTRLRAARDFRAANAQMRQLSFGFVDLALHREYSPERDGNVIAYTRGMMNAFSPVPLKEDHAMINAFTHLFASAMGYAAGYYSYKWAEVLDADAFTAFKKEGIFSREAGLRFRNEILARGDAADPAELYRAFVGRDPDSRALLARAGLL